MDSKTEFLIPLGWFWCSYPKKVGYISSLTEEEMRDADNRKTAREIAADRSEGCDQVRRAGVRDVLLGRIEYSKSQIEYHKGQIKSAEASLKVLDKNPGLAEIADILREIR